MLSAAFLYHFGSVLNYDVAEGNNAALHSIIDCAVSIVVSTLLIIRCHELQMAC